MPLSLDQAAGSTAVAAPVTLAPAATAAPAGRTWLLSPWRDLFLISFVWWPLLVAVFVYCTPTARESVTFVQMYLLTTPHRWITLALVFLDPDKFRERPRTFVTMGAAALGLCALVLGLTGSLLLLLAVDYAWNTWHFAAQHSGIHRIYGRMARPSVTTGAMYEKFALRLFILYGLLRIALATLPASSYGGLFGVLGEWGFLFAQLDHLVLVLPASLLVRELLDFRAAAAGRLVYLTSVTALYVTTLWAIRNASPWVLGLMFAVTVFHALEYMTIVSWSVLRKKRSAGVLALLAPRWTVALVAYVIALGAGASLMTLQFAEVWIFMNLTVSLLHYGYDGLIWRQPRAVRA